MDGGCGSVSMDRYWNNIGTPLFFIVLGFGLFVLFSLSGIQTASPNAIFSIVARMPPPPPARRQNSGAGSPPPKAPPSSAPPATPPASPAGRAERPATPPLPPRRAAAAALPAAARPADGGTADEVGTAAYFATVKKAGRDARAAAARDEP